MLRLRISRFIVALLVFLVLIFTTGCLTLRTIPPKYLNELRSKREILKIHSDDSLWIIQQYEIRDNVLSGKIYRNREGILKLKTADIYVAPSSAVRIEGDFLIVSTINIGKVDYLVLDGLMIASSIGIAIVLLLFSPWLFN